MQIKTGLLGASGYTGADLVRLLSLHPNVSLEALTANTHAGKDIGEVFTQLGMLSLPTLTRWDEVDWQTFDAVFCALPHGTTQEIVQQLPKSIKVIDLSADFRLRDGDVYERTYAKPHQAADLQKEAVYGLTEWAREVIKKARLVACPGCYPTATLLALLPLVAAGDIDPQDIIIDAKSGVSGAGRKVQERTLFCETAESMSPYSIGTHRHSPEIEQELARFSGRDLFVNFTPHLIPMNRGELVTCYVRLEKGKTHQDIRKTLQERYGAEYFIKVLDEGRLPDTRQVRGSNFCVMNVFADRIPGRAIIIAAIDNLVKGSSGQAIQNFNLMFGLPETTALEQLPLYP